MTRYTYVPLANGLSTDHPIPDLPFVDDSHIPVKDPHAVEAIGRKKGRGMWGREDPCHGGSQGWAAFTTDPIRKDLGWAVRWHPEHGRSVVLYRNSDTAGVHDTWRRHALLFRSGGYWWDGNTWYRPSQVWDRAAEEYFQRPVPAATTVMAHALLATGADAERGQALQVSDVDPQSRYAGRWADDLALWAARRTGQDLPLAQCVVSLTAPELSGDQLVGANEMAEAAGIAASTLRAYLSREESDVPLPQAAVGGRNLWSRPVAEDWVESRSRSYEGLTATVSIERSGASLPPGLAALWDRFAREFFSRLWDHPDLRKRWALRWRTEEGVREVCEDLGWHVAGNLGDVISTQDLAVTVQAALLDELADGRGGRTEIGKTTGVTYDHPVFYGINAPVARMLDWLVQHHPSVAAHVIGLTVGEAERRLGIPRKVVEQSISTALHLDSKLDEETVTAFLARTLSPGYDD